MSGPETSAAPAGPSENHDNDDMAEVRRRWLGRDGGRSKATSIIKQARRRSGAGRQEEGVRILGLVRHGEVFQVAVIRDDDEDQKVCVMALSEARRRFPFQLSLFYEAHVQFVEENSS